MSTSDALLPNGDRIGQWWAVQESRHFGEAALIIERDVTAPPDGRIRSGRPGHLSTLKKRWRGTMRIYIAGQKVLGQQVYDLCVKRGHEIAGVSAPAHAGDGEKPDRLRAAAEADGVLWLESGKLNADTLPDGVDLIVAAHSHDFIGKKTREKARLGAIGYHPSLLPLHRGRDAIIWTIHMGEKVTGGTVYWMNDVMDGGDIAAQEHCFVPPGISAGDLWRETLHPLGLKLYEKVLGDLEQGIEIREKQNHDLATWEPSWNRPKLKRPDPES